MIEIPDNANEWQVLFSIHDPISGEACDADALPTVAFRYTDGASNGTAAEVVGTVSNIGTGIYALAIDLSAAGPLTPSYVVTPVITAVVGGVTQKAPLESFRAAPPFVWGTVVADGSNSATGFEVSGTFDDTTDSLKESLLVFIDHANRCQMRPVTAYDATTNFVTVGQGGFPVTPTAGDRFLVVFK